MKPSFFRPWLLIVLSAAVVAGALVVVFQRPPAQGPPTPLPVSGDQREIVWLYPATNAASWERFVAAVRRTAERLQDRGRACRADVGAAFPRQTTVVPEVSLICSADAPRFVFRWYKLTGDWKTRDWVEALLKRQPPPLAIIGGSSSDSARELAIHLHHAAKSLPAPRRPLLLLTSATADNVAPDDAQDKLPGQSVPLTRLYPERTFRFCFSNKQMAAAVSNFIWRRDDLRPDSDPLYMVQWNDDSYSRDLTDGFGAALRREMAGDAANLIAWLGSLAGSDWPWGLRGGILAVTRMPVYANHPDSGSTLFLTAPPMLQRIDSSVGSFAIPNPHEERAAGALLDELMLHGQTRPLLVVAGQSQPSRRFLRGLVRGVPSLSKHMQIVVATGDGVSFNTVYRDRQAAWNIQDLPFPLVFFCHRNPIDAEAGFRRGNAAAAKANGQRDSAAETGTDDILLYGDVVETLLQTAVPADAAGCVDAGELCQRLARTRRQGDAIALDGQGVSLFDGDGQRQNGTGEHIVCLQLLWDEDYKYRLLPRATLEVWTWLRRDGDAGQSWQRRGEPLIVDYTDRRDEGGPAHDGR